jgi:protoporphyrinogen/coproporphyrinogen III oxidase
MILTPLLSPFAKLRALGEPFIPRNNASDESVADFVRRRAGTAVLETLVGPYVSGIFAGDPNQLSVRSAFPIMAKMEHEHGSIVRAALARMKQQRANAAAANVAADLQVRSGDQSPGRPRRRSFGFRGGNDVLPRALAQHLGTDVRLNAPVKAIWQRGEWMELLVGGNMDTRVVAKSVVIAAPAAAAAELLEPLELRAADALRSFEYPTVVQIAFAYPRTEIGVPLDGFGFLVPRTEGLRILGCVWNSAMFPDRCPENEVLVTVFLGGATDPSVAGQSDEELARQAHDELRGVLKIRDASPHIVAGFRWQEAIPQYNVGHAQKIKVISDCLARLPQVRLCGSYLRGPSVPDCIATSRATLS